MTLVRRTSALGELVSLRQAMDRLFEDSVVRPRSWGMGADTSASLPLDITNTPDALVVAASLPGIARKTSRSRSETGHSPSVARPAPNGRRPKAKSSSRNPPRSGNPVVPLPNGPDPKRGRPLSTWGVPLTSRGGNLNPARTPQSNFKAGPKGSPAPPQGQAPNP